MTDQNTDVPSSKETQIMGFYEFFTSKEKTLTNELLIAKAMDTTGVQRRAELDRLAEEVHTLQQAVQEASIYLPSHDQARYASSIKDFQTKLSTARTEGQPKAKFSFKSGRKITPATPASATDSTETLKGSQESTPTPKTEGTTPFPPLLQSGDRTTSAISSSSNSSEFDELSYKHLLSDVSTNNTLSNITHSIVDMRHPSTLVTPSHATLAIRDVKDSLLILGVVEGATHVTRLRNSVLVAETGQLRMHECRDVDVYLKVASKPIIEGCEGVRVAPFPDTTAVPHLKTKYSKASPSNSPVITANRPNRWSEVDDFNHLKQSASPNWSVLPEEKRIKDETWRDVVPGTDRIGLTDILNAVGVRNAEKGRSRRGSEACGGDGF